MHTFLVTSNSVKKAGKFKKDLPKMVGFFSTRDNLPTRKKAREDNPQIIWVIGPNSLNFGCSLTGANGLDGSAG